MEKACVDSSSMMSPAGLSAEIMERQGYSQRKKAVYSGAFRGLGITAALHPRNPHVPSLHLNLRYFDSLDGSHFVVMGSIDVTPFSSASRPLVAQFHRELHEVKFQTHLLYFVGSVSCCCLQEHDKLACVHMWISFMHTAVSAIQLLLRPPEGACRSPLSVAPSKGDGKRRGHFL